jgi:NitT/TauT family transport system permease protein
MAARSQPEASLAAPTESPGGTLIAPRGRRLWQRLTPVVSGIVVLALWEGISRGLAVPAYLVPSPSAILGALVEQRLVLLHHTRLTVVETLGGFVVGSLFSIAFGLLVVHWPFAKAVVMPYMIVIQTTPKVALAPLFIIWFGFGLTTNIIYTALIAFFPVLVNFVQGLEDVNPNEQRLMATYNASTWQLFRHVHLYRSLPYLFAGLKMAAVLALIGAVVSEFVAGDGGLGYYMVQAQALLRVKEAFAALAILAVLGLLFYLLIDAIQRLVAPWARRFEGGRDVV